MFAFRFRFRFIFFVVLSHVCMFSPLFLMLMIFAAHAAAYAVLPRQRYASLSCRWRR